MQKHDTSMICVISLLMSLNSGLVSVNRIKLSLQERLSQLHARGRCASRHSCVLGQRKSQGRFFFCVFIASSKREGGSENSKRIILLGVFTLLFINTYLVRRFVV